MAKLSFMPFFIAALVFSAMYVWPCAEAERKCSEFIDFQKCTNHACVEKCKSNHGSSFRRAACEGEPGVSQKSCQCYYHC